MTDLSPWLRAWPWRPGGLEARLASGADGRPVVQVRLELGLLQMDADGRPDGLSYRDGPTAVAWFAARPKIPIDAEAALDLETESAQRRQRNAALAILNDWRRSRRDAAENLLAIDLLAARAERQEDRTRLERWRPHELAMRARAEASMALEVGRRDLARQALEEGLREVRQATVAGEAVMAAPAAMLTGLLDVLTPRLPSSERAELEDRLQAAVRAENFELAAILRDELRLLGGAR